MTTELQDRPLEERQTRTADENTVRTPEQEPAEPRPKAGAGAAENPPGDSAAGAEPGGNGAAEAENGAPDDAEAWTEEPAEGEGAVAALDAETEASESVTEQLKNKLRRNKAPGPEIKKMKADLEKALSDGEALRDKYLRLAAEFDNYRKRIDRDFNNRVQTAFAELVAGLLPVLDDLERSLHTKAEQQNYESLQNGVQLIQQKFAKVLAERGLEPMQAVGAEFEPNVHDALTEMAVEGKPAGLVLEEHAKGYMYRDRVLRPAKVIVSK